jgi:hypothetical protein
MDRQPPLFSDEVGEVAVKKVARSGEVAGIHRG